MEFVGDGACHNGGVTHRGENSKQKLVVEVLHAEAPDPQERPRRAYELILQSATRAAKDRAAPNTSAVEEVRQEEVDDGK